MVGSRAVTVRPAIVGLVLLSVAVAGCVAPSAEELDPGSLPGAAEWWLRAIPNGEDHEHADPAQHVGLSTPNFRVLGYDDLQTETYGKTLHGMGCGGAGTTADGRRIAVVHSISTDVSFVVADVTDPAAPQMLGEYYMPNAVIWDATVTPDGMHVLVGAYPYWIFALFSRDPAAFVPTLPKPEADVPLQLFYRDACTGETRDLSPSPEQYLPFGPGIVMVGLQDPTQPKLEDWVPQPWVGPHSVSAAEVDGVTYATSSVTNLVHQISYYSFFEVASTPAGSQLEPLSVIRAPGGNLPFTGNGHIDVEIAKHPITGQVLAYLANWDAGVSIYDLTDPRMPEHVGTWTDGDAGSLHTTLPLPDVWADGRHYTIAGQEVGEPEDLPTGWVYILDTTDPADIQEVGRWTLPYKFPWGKEGEGTGLRFSPHYVEVVNETLFVSNYHGGVWAVDLADLKDPEAVGVFVPDREPAEPLAEEGREVSVEDVIAYEDGVLTAWDGSGGIYQLRFNDAMRWPRAPAWQE